MIMDRAAVFIDGGYLNKVLLDLGRPRIDFGHFVRSLTTDLRLFRSYYYQCPSFRSDPPSEDEQERYTKQERFFAALRRMPDFEVRLGYLAHRGFDAQGRPIFHQKGCDTWLSVDMLRLSLQGRIEYACLVAGDDDFCPVVAAAKDAGVGVHVFHGDGPNSRYSSKLWDLCDRRTALSSSFLRLGSSPAPGELEHF